ncbi:MAG TPA: hypothetical protein PK597_05845 [Oscillospiraceae bacterium]|nr:hypothetical protein [Oscillospiraceae bacterium]
MARLQAGRETFVVRILSTQNATWQGTVAWTDGGKTQPFRSALELMKLIDSTLGKTEEETQSQEGQTQESRQPEKIPAS